jgi:hypothetical protein
MESFSPGYRLQDTDLNITFYAQGIAYPPSLTYPYSPYALTYEVDFFNSDGRIIAVGPLDRTPEKVTDIIFRPDFVVDSTWATGFYQITWKYRTFSYSDIQTVTQPFEILNNGIAGVPFILSYCNRDIPATFYVVLDYQDLPASFSIIP